MKEAFINNSINFIETYDKNIDKEKLAYGLEGLYLTITKLVIITLIAILLGIFKEYLLTLVFFNILRYPGFGMHADSSKVCLISSSLLLLGIPLLLTYVIIPILVKVVISSICLIAFILYAPADTKKRPLTNKKKRMMRKITAVLLASVYLILIVLFKNNYLTNLMFGGLIIETILILPITYKLFKLPYRNYLKV